MGRVYIEAKNAMAKRKKWIESFPSGLKWINCLPSPNTKIQYATYLKIYCDAVQKTPEELIQLKINGLKHTGDSEEFQAEELLENFFINSKMKPNAKLSMKNAVFSFYKWNRRALEKTTANNVKTALPSAKTRTPTLEDIQALEDNVSTQRDKAIIRFISSTALRVGSLSKLTWLDLKETGNSEVPFMLEVEAGRLKGSGFGKYKGIKHICFINKWAVEKLEEYKKEAQLKGYTIKETESIFIRYYQANRDKNEGLTSKGFFQLFDSASLRAWKDLEEKKFSPHDLRSFVQSALETANIHPNIISPLLGHKVKGIDSSYSQHNIEELSKSYISALPFLVPKTVSALEVELKTTESKFKTQQSQIEELKGLVTQLLNHEKDMNFSTLSTPQDKQESEEFLTVFNESRNQKEAFFTASQRLNDFSKTIRSKQHLAIGSLSLEDITPSLRRLEKEHNLDFSRMKPKQWFYEGIVFNSPEFKQNKKPYQINKALKAQLTPETPEQRRETLSDKVLKWLNPQKYLDLQIKKLAEAQKETPKSLLKKNGIKEASHDFEELEEKELNGTLNEEERDNLEEERDLREIEEEFI